MKILCVIPARGGSKTIPRKNLQTFAGKPLIAWTIEAAKQSPSIQRTIVSTEDDEIAKVARELGCEVPFKRPSELAKDDTPGIAPVLHAVNEIKGFDYVLLLQPTSPLRTVSDIEGIVHLCMSRTAHSAVSVCQVTQHPYWMYECNPDSSLRPVIPSNNFVTRRQDLPPVYELNGALYLSKISWLRSNKSFIGEGTLGFEMPAERSVDIDTRSDWEAAEKNLLQALKSQPETKHPVGHNGGACLKSDPNAP